jgi:hypothetical protein
MPNSPERSYVNSKPGWDFTHDGIGASNPAVKLTVADAPAFSIDNNSNHSGIVIDHDSDLATDVYAVTIVNDNAGTGKPGGIDFSSFANDEPILKVATTGTAPQGTVAKAFPVAIAGTSTLYYVTLHAAA